MAIMTGVSKGMMGVQVLTPLKYLSEKGFYSVTFVMTLFAVITIQKNTRDMENTRKNLGKSILNFEKEDVL